MQLSTAETVTGVVLRVTRLTETSLIVNWLTAEHGRLATVAKGARRPKSPFQGKLDLFYEASFSFRRSRRSELHNLAEVRLLQTHPLLRQDLACLRMASYASQLVERTTETDTPLPGVFALMRGLLSALEPMPRDARAVLAFELKLLDELGFGGDYETGVLPLTIQKLATGLAECDWKQLEMTPVPAGELARLEKHLRGFVLKHLGNVPRTRDAAVNVGAP